MSKSAPKLIGITLGDPAGIGPEVTFKALARISSRYRGRFLLIGDPATLKPFDKFKNVGAHPVGLSYDKDWKLGLPTKNSGRASLDFLRASVELLKRQTIQSLVTAPLAKEAVCRFERGFIGHTEYLAQVFGVKRFDMMFVTDRLKTVIVTRHIPIADVPGSITSQKVFDSIDLTHTALKTNFRIRVPRIAVCGLNPHAGEGGLIGTEEIKSVTPAIRRAQARGIKAAGPFSGDTMFVSKNSRDFDAVICMYHDQGLIAMKSMFFSQVVNMTIGLPFVRTCPAHGTAFDIAGKNRADPSSMTSAIKLALELT